jgi:acetolactate synthase-1/2/3 large subunit
MGVVRAALRQPGTGLLLSGVALQEPGLRAAGRLATAHGVSVFANRYAARLTRGRGVFEARRLPYFPEPAWQLLAGIRTMITVEAAPPVSFFGYLGLRSTLAPENCTFLTLAEEGEDGVQSLEELAQGLPDDGCTEYDPPPSPQMDDALTLDSLGQSLAALLPEGSIVADEMVSSGEAVNAWLARAAKHDLLPVTGGSIGQGLPVAVGAAVACPDRYVIALEADGSAMYSMQSLWTMARERLDVVVVILANRRYRILEVEMQRTGAGRMGPRADTLMDLHDPVIDWVALGRGMGVRSRLATTVQEFRDAFCEGLKYGGPCLIEAVLPSAPAA